MSSLPEVGMGGTGQPEPPCRALREERVPPRSVRAVPVGWGIPGAAPAWPHRKLLLLLAWELPTPGCSGLCRFCGGRTRHVSLETSCSTAGTPGDGHSLAPGTAAAWAKLAARQPLGWARAGSQTSAFPTHLLFLLLFLFPLPFWILLFFLLFLLVVGVRGGFWRHESVR